MPYRFVRDKFEGGVEARLDILRAKVAKMKELKDELQEPSTQVLRDRLRMPPRRPAIDTV